ncbi:hypothetical protein [Flavobacterium sp.]
MEANTTRNDNPEETISQRNQLSFYEEHYILEPETEDQNPYEDGINYDFGFMKFSYSRV